MIKLNMMTDRRYEGSSCMVCDKGAAWVLRLGNEQSVSVIRLCQTDLDQLDDLITDTQERIGNPRC